MQLPNHFFNSRRLEQLVENKTSYTISNAELNVYETHHYAEQVMLQFSQPVLASMLEGKKVMHLRDRTPFNFLPGESLCLPADEIMCIDFPEAEKERPTRCLAMQIDRDLIRNILDNMNESMPKADQAVWDMSNDNFTFTNDHAIHQLIQRLIFVFMEDHPSKETFIELMMRELIIRIKQTENLDTYHNTLLKINNANRMAFVIQFIKDHLHEALTVSKLAEKANMSEPNFHRVFKNEIGMSPIHFINQTRIKRATAMLSDPHVTLKEVFLSCGFSNPSYFNRTFKKIHGISPKAYQRGLA
ncbi:MAG: AraC family transcriptional regulator [Ekhidna sp.]|nr:AraC family transcriptional regulator [Ekhidna sp.]